MGPPRTRGFTLIEVLVAIAIIGILIGLMLPAVQNSRESGRALQCRNNLHQIGIAVLAHENVHHHFPTGGWGWRWVGDPNRGYDAGQPGGWIYNVLPYIEQGYLRNLGEGQDQKTKWALAATLQSTFVPGFNCPSRRTEGLYQHVDPATVFNSDPTQFDMRADYAMNGGDCAPKPSCGPKGYNDKKFVWPDTKDQTGICYQRSDVRMADITDGASNTYLVAEKYLNAYSYTSGTDRSDDFSMFQGYDMDIVRWTGEKDEDGKIVPLPPLVDDRHTTALNSFGSAHPHGFNAVFCDGSVHTIGYTIDPQVHLHLGGRADHQTIDTSQFAE